MTETNKTDLETKDSDRYEDILVAAENITYLKELYRQHDQAGEICEMNIVSRILNELYGI